MLYVGNEHIYEGLFSHKVKKSYSHTMGLPNPKILWGPGQFK